MAVKKISDKGKKAGKTVAGKHASKAGSKNVIIGNDKAAANKPKNKNSSVKKDDAEVAKSYKELITEGLLELKDRKGSSRPALKKFIKEKYPKMGNSVNFDMYFNNAVKKGVETKDFDQPKGPSGTIKLVKKAGTITRASPVNGVGKPSEKSAATKKTHEKEKTVKKSASPPANPTYKDMILAGLLKLNDGKGSSRSALKKFVKDEFFSTAKTTSNFDHLFNSAIKKGVETGAFSQPKGPSGLVKKGKGKPLMQKITA